MYGIVNKSIQELVIRQFGNETWEKVRLHSGIQEEFFLSNQGYDDQITYDLAQSVAQVAGISLSEALTAFGEFWVMHTGKEKYGSLMEGGGNTLKEFLINLPNFHSRVILFYPNLTPPEFRITDIGEDSLHLHYFSKREGLKDFVKGLIQGLAVYYQTPVTIKLLESREAGSDHETYKICW